MRKPTRLPYRGRLTRLGEVSKAIRSAAAPGYWRQHVHRESVRNTGSPEAWSAMTNRTPGKEDTNDGSPGQTVRHPARFTHLTVAGESVHAPVRAGMEDARAGAKPRHSHRDLRRRSRDPVQKRQRRRGFATTARDHGQAEAHGQRGEDTNLQGAGRGVRLPGVHVWADVFSENRPSAL